jgi:hypothetical protein
VKAVEASVVVRAFDDQRDGGAGECVEADVDELAAGPRLRMEIVKPACPQAACQGKGRN